MNEEKILNLQLIYKGEHLDYAREQRDIKNSFTIGSDKYLQWQILDSRFPKKHLFVKRASKNTFKLLLAKGMKLSIKRGEQELDEAALKRNNILKGNELIIDKGMTGKVDFADEWSIAFNWIVPWKKVLTSEEKRMIHELQRYPDLTQQQKLQRNVFIIAALLLLILGFLFERFYEPPVIERTVAHLVSIPTVTTPPPPKQEFRETYDAVEGVEEIEGAVEAEGVPGGGRLAGLDIGKLGPPSLDLPTGGMQLVTYGERLTSGAGRGGGGGAGPGPGGGGGPGPRGGGRATFDVDATGPRVAAGTVLGGGIDVKRLGVREVDPSLLAGQTGIQATHISTTNQLVALAQARERAASAGLTVVTEEAIEHASPQVQATMANIRQYVDTYWRQIEELFQEERQVRDMYGSLVVTLYFSPDGRVEGVNLDQRPGSFFTERFKERAREHMMGWRIPTTQQLQPYEFTRRFLRN